MAIGLLVTLAGCGLFAWGAFDRLNLIGLDQHFRHLSTIKADPRIVLIDIDDQALTAVDRYPWPRRRYAQLIDTLRELGADRIVLDIVLSEPSEPRVARARLDRYYDVESGLAELGDPSQDAVIFDDDELAAAMARAGNVYLAMFFPMTRSPNAFILPPMSLDLFQPFDGPLFAAIQQRDAGTAQEFLDHHPEGTWQEFFQSVIPNRQFDALTWARANLRSAYLSAHSRGGILRQSPSCPSFVSAAPGLYRTESGTFPLSKLTATAKGVGFVSLPREGTHSVVRDIPLVVGIHDQLLYQLGCLVALDVLGLDQTRAEYRSRELVLGAEPATRQLPWSKNGTTLINWHVPRRAGRWEESFEHLSSIPVMAVALNREGVADNEKRLGIALGDLVELRHAETPAEFGRYAELVNQRLAANASARSRHRTAEELAAIEKQIGEIEEEAVVWLKRVWGLWQATEPANDVERAEKDKLHKFFEELAEGRLRDRLVRSNEAIEQYTARLLKELEPRIRGKICLVGYTASAVADLVATPVYSTMPGVMAHANVINMILQDKPAWQATSWMNLLLIFASGLGVTLVTSVRRPLIGLATLFTVVLVVFVGGALLFWFFTVHVASVIAALVAAMAWVSVTLYRQLIAERARRDFQRALAQYTSPAVANRIAEDRGAESLAPQPAVVTCFFADLAGFTALSERLGPERTRLVLNPYLTAMSRVLIEHNGLVNKFMGDGVFAFFNAPIWPCGNHVEAACGSALAAQEALTRLNRGVDSSNGEMALAMRIGLTTGEVFVGDYGSDSKLDYTCIGDTVNLGSRLEKANRALGTGILVDEATRRAARARFFFRRLGRFYVAGKSLPIEIAELVGLTERVDPSTRTFVERFEEAIASFQRCDWGACLTLLGECGRMRPADRVVRRYTDEAERLKNTSGPVPLDDGPALKLI